MLRVKTKEPTNAQLDAVYTPTVEEMDRAAKAALTPKRKGQKRCN
jgi:hypothetical protein